MRIVCSVGSHYNLSPKKFSSLSPFYLRESFVGGGLQRDDESVCVCVLVYTHLRSGFLLFFFYLPSLFFLGFCRKLPRSILCSRPAGTYLFCSRLKREGEEKETPMPRVRLFILYLDTEEDTSKGRVLVLTEKKTFPFFFFLKCVDMSSDSIETLGSASFF